MADSIKHAPKEGQSNNFDPFEYEELNSPFSPKEELLILYKEKGFYGETISRFHFEEYINKIIPANGENIAATKFDGSKFFIKLKDNSEIIFSIQDIHELKLSKILKGETLENTEKKSKMIHLAMESIFKDNEGIIWDNDIDNEDKFSLYTYLRQQSGIVLDRGGFSQKNNLTNFEKTFFESLEGENLQELREIYQVENKKLSKSYEVINDTKKQTHLMKQELEMLSGVGDLFEAGAGYFGMNTDEINEMASKIIGNMTVNQSTQYIKRLHQSIEQNGKKSDMVKQVNLKVIDAMSKTCFLKITKENSPYSECIELAKICTGRGKLEIEHAEKYNTKQKFEYDDLEMDSEFKSVDLANRILIYLMQREGGIIDKIEAEEGINNKKLSDPALKGRTPQGVISEARKLLQANTEVIFESIGFSKYLNIDTPYAELSFDDKVAFGTIARIITSIKTIPPADMQNSEKLSEHIKRIALEQSEDTLNVLNEAFGKKFDSWGGFYSNDSEDYGLKGDFAEVFELYRDINGNGFFDISDGKKDFITPTLRGTLVFLATLLAAAAAMSLVPVIATATGSALLAAGVTQATVTLLAPIIGFISATTAFGSAGGVTGVVSSVGSRTGYDSMEEALSDFFNTIKADAKVGAAFGSLGFAFFKSLGFLSGGRYASSSVLDHSFFSARGGTELLAFGGGETLYNMFKVAPELLVQNRKSFPENHFNTDESSREEELLKK